MTQTLDEKGRMRAVTVIKTGPHKVVQVKTSDKDGYDAIQLGFDTITAKKLNKADLGHQKGDTFRHLCEFDFTADAGSELNPFETITTGTEVVISGTSKSKGFQGTVKRHGFKGDKRSHGRKHSERKPGSIGGGGRAGGRVVKGMRMAGRMGGDRVSVKGLEVLYTNPETNEVFVSGAVPGRRGSLVEIHIAK